MVKIKDFTLASKNLWGHMPPCPTELPPVLFLLKVERQIDSDQLIYVQGILEAESRAETRGERWQRRNESRKRDAKREKTTNNDRLKLDLVRHALVYRESATAVVVSHVERDLHEHANGCRKKSTSTLLAPLT